MLWKKKKKTFSYHMSLTWITIDEIWIRVVNSMMDDENCHAKIRACGHYDKVLTVSIMKSTGYQFLAPYRLPAISEVKVS